MGDDSFDKTGRNRHTGKWTDWRNIQEEIQYDSYRLEMEDEGHGGGKDGSQGFVSETGQTVEAREES